MRERKKRGGVRRFRIRKGGTIEPITSVVGSGRGERGSGVQLERKGGRSEASGRN